MKSRPPEGGLVGRTTFHVPVYQAGDVLHRMLVRVDEVKESLAILHAAAKIGSALFVR